MSLHGTCRFCETPLHITFVDLGASPLANSYLALENIGAMEPFYPLHVQVCENCFLVQLSHSIKPEEIFRDYAYFSSYSDTWLAHSKAYVQDVSTRLGLNESSHVIEIAGNDGYLLQYFLEKNIPVLNIEPAINVAKAAQEKGIATITEFFGVDLAHSLVSRNLSADLLLGNNVLAHVPDINDFVEGLKILLKPTGVVTMEFPHLLRLMEHNQFDTIYHEHYSYLSLLTVMRIFSAHDLKIFDVAELPTHGGSLRIYAGQHDDDGKPISDRVGPILAKEEAAGLVGFEAYEAFSEKVKRTKRRILEMLIRIKNEGKTIVGYGAPAKGNTLLNYCGIRTDFLDYTVDRSPHKQGLFLPGTRIPIHHPDRVQKTQPDYLLILPWNLKDEIMYQMSHIREWGGKFIVPIPDVRVT